MFRLSEITVWLVLMCVVWHEVTSQLKHIILLKDDKTDDFWMTRDLSVTTLNNVTIEIRNVTQHTIISDLKYLCDNVVGKTAILDLTGSCLVYDNAAFLLTPYIRSSASACPCNAGLDDPSPVGTSTSDVTTFLSGLGDGNSNSSNSDNDGLDDPNPAGNRTVLSSLGDANSSYSNSGDDKFGGAIPSGLNIGGVSPSGASLGGVSPSGDNSVGASSGGPTCCSTSDIQPYAAAAFSFITRQRSSTAKVILFLDSRFDSSDYIMKMYSMISPVKILDLDASKSKLKTWIKNMSTKTTPLYLVAIGRTNQISFLLENVPAAQLSQLIHWTIVLIDDVTVYWDTYDWKKLVVFRHSSKESTEALSYHLRQISERMTIHSLKNTSTESRCKQYGTNSSYETNDKIYTRVYLPPHIVLDVLSYESTEYGNITFKQVGEWTTHTGLNLTSSLDTGIHNHFNTLRVVTKHEPPFVFRNVIDNTVVFTGYAIDTFKIVASRLGINYTLYEPDDKQYGIKLPDGSWSGIIGELVSGYADVAVAALPITTERRSVVDMTTPFYEFGGIQIMMKANQAEPSMMAFTTVFSEFVWACYAVLLVVSGVLIFVCERFSPYAPAKRQPVNTYWAKFNVSKGLWFVASSFTQAGAESTPHTFSARMLISGFWFFCSIMLATYTANLAAFLTQSRMTIPIESLDDLASQRAVKYSVVAGTSTHSYFERMATIEMNFYERWKSMTTYVRQKDLSSTLVDVAVWDYPLVQKYEAIWHSIKETGLLNSTEQGIEKTMEGNFAFIHEYPMLQYELLKHCGLTSVGKQFSAKPYAFALPHASPLSKKMSDIILEMQAETILENLKSKWWNTTSLSCSSIDESSGMTFHTLGGIFILLAAGMTVGILFFMLELIWATIRNKKRKEDFNMVSPLNTQTNLALDSQPDTTSGDGEEIAYLQTSM